MKVKLDLENKSCELDLTDDELDYLYERITNLRVNLSTSKRFTSTKIGMPLDEFAVIETSTG